MLLKIVPPTIYVCGVPQKALFTGKNDNKKKTFVKKNNKGKVREKQMTAHNFNI